MPTLKEMLLGKYMDAAQQGMQQGSNAVLQDEKGKQDLMNKLAEMKATHASDLDSQQTAQDRAVNLMDQLGAKYGNARKFNVGVSKEGVTLAEQQADPIKSALAQDRQDKLDRAETEAIRNNMTKLAGKDIDKVKAAKVAEDLISDPTISSMTLARDAYARAAVGGKVPQDMANKIFGPKSISEFVRSTAGGLLGHPEWDAIPPTARDAYLHSIRTDAQAPADNVQSAINATKGLSGTIAPSLTRAKKIDNVLNEYGDTLGSYAPKKNATVQPAPTQPSAVSGAAPQTPKSVAAKHYSPSRNQTRITYSDGTQEIKDGQQ